MQLMPSSRTRKSVEYKVLLEKTDEGYSVWCPGLPGCWSQGATQREAVDNIRDAIAGYLETVASLSKGRIVRRVKVPA